MKLVRTIDGIFESEESVPTAKQRALGVKVLSSKLKVGSKAAVFLKIKPADKLATEVDQKVVAGV